MTAWHAPADAAPPRALLRWVAAACVVLAAHGAAAWIAATWQSVDTPVSEPPPAAMLDLAPLAVAPEAPPQDIAPGPQMVEAQPEHALDTPDRLVEDKPPDRPTPPAPEPEIRIPELPKSDHAEVVLASPPKPQAAKKPPPKQREIENRKPVDPDRPKRQQTAAPPTVRAQRADAAAAPSAGYSAAASVSPASWKSEVMAHLNRYKRFPSGAGAGVASVAFSIARSGAVLSARLTGSSGDAALDAEAVSMPHRASPLPPPPPGVGGSITLTVPIRFNR